MHAEGEAIIDELEKHPTVKARLATAPDRAFALRYLKDYDVVHFAGHADYVAAAPGQSGWTLADGKLTADEIVKLGGGRPMPMVVFGNACQSGHTTAWDGDTTAVFGLANAFLTAGVRHYLGTQWEMVDGQSALFAGRALSPPDRRQGDRRGGAARARRRGRARGRDGAGVGLLRALRRSRRAAAASARAEAEAVDPLGAQDRRARLGAVEAAGGHRRARARDARSRRARACRRGLPAALAGVAAGLVGVTVAAWLMHRKPAPLGGHPTLAGVAVLPLSTGDADGDQQKARDLEGCLPLQLATDRVAVVAPERLMTLVAQTNGAFDRASARAVGLAAGARWVVYGNVAAGIGEPVRRRGARRSQRLRRQLPPRRSRAPAASRFAAAAAARLAAEPPPATTP